MKLDHISLDQLKASPLNVRKKGGKDVSDLTASIRSLGLLQPLLVRKNCEGFDIIAGQRRFNAVSALAEEGVFEGPVPCIVMEHGDDAKAIEASLAENIARLPMDEIDQYKAFAAMHGEGDSVADIAAKFGVTERLVEQRLAIANIIPPILNAYRRDEIRPETLRLLTMATHKQQKAWWKLHQSQDDYAPTGHALKEWLFGGEQIPVSNALFDIASYDGAIIADLFGEERYFADPSAFWTRQNAAIAERGQNYLDAGWREVVVLDVGQHFALWNHTKTPKKKGGRVYVEIARDGEVTLHEGWLTAKEAQQRTKAKTDDAGKEGMLDAVPAATERSELTAPMRNYLGLHRHGAVRTELLAHTGLSLRLAVAHIIAGSSLWKVEAEPQRADNEAVASSLSAAKAQSGFAAERTHIRSLLGWTGGGDDDADGETIVRSRFSYGRRPDIDGVLNALLALDDRDVMRILTFAMAESLAAHSSLVDGLGARIGTDMAAWWSPDEAFFTLLRDKQAINAMLREVAGDVTADAHVASTAKVQKKIIADCLKGDGRPKVENWLPRYMRFPAATYLDRDTDAEPAVPDDDGTAPEDAVVDDGGLDVGSADADERTARPKRPDGTTRRPVLDRAAFLTMATIGRAAARPAPRHGRNS